MEKLKNIYRTWIRNTFLCILLIQHSWALIIFEDSFDNHADWSPPQLLETQGDINCKLSDGCTGVPVGYDGFCTRIWLQ